MAKAGVETSRIRDAARDSKIRMDNPSMLKQWSDSVLPESFHAKAGLRHNRRHDVHRVGRDLARISADEVSRRINHQSYHDIDSSKHVDFNSKFDESERWFHVFNENEDPFSGLYSGYEESDSLVTRFKRNLQDFDGFWHTEDLLSWIDAIEDFFQEISPPEHLKCKIVWYKMKGAAYYWWKQLQRERIKHGKDKIISWPRMRGLLISRFAPGYCSMKCPAEVYKGTQSIDESSLVDNCKVSKCGDDSLDSLGHDVTIDNKETEVGKVNEETKKDLELETSKKDVVNNFDCLLIPTQEIPCMLSFAKGPEFGGTTVKLACPVLSILHDPLNDVWTHQHSLLNSFLQACWGSTYVCVESTCGSLQTKQHSVELLLLSTAINAYYDVDVFLFDPGGNILLSSSVGSENYFLSCSGRLNSNGFFHLLEDEVRLLLLKRFYDERDKEMVAPIISEKPNIFRINDDSQMNDVTYHINDLGFVKETYIITWGLFGYRTNKPSVLMSASSVLQPRNIEQGKLPDRLTGHADLTYYVAFIPYDNVNEILIKPCWTREVHSVLLYHLAMVSIPITLSFDPRGSPCSLKIGGILAFIVYADSCVLNVLSDTKCDERHEGVTTNIILVFRLLTNELECGLRVHSVYRILIAGVTYEDVNLSHDNLSSFALTKVRFSVVVSCGNLNILVFDEIDHVVDEHGLKPLYVGIMSHVLIPFDPGGFACFLITWLPEFCDPALVELETKYGKEYLMSDEERGNVALGITSQLANKIRGDGEDLLNREGSIHWVFCDPFRTLTSILWPFMITVSTVVALPSTLLLALLECFVIEDL